MGSLIKNELKKCFSNKLITRLIVILFIVTIGVYYANEVKYREYLYNNKEYIQKQFEKYNRQFITTSLKEVDKRIDKLNDEYFQIIGMDIWGEEDIGTVNNNNSEEMISNQMSVNTFLKEKLEYMLSYKAFLAKIKENKENMLKVSIFQKEGSFSYRNIIKTEEDFEKLNDIKLQFDMDQGVVSLTDTQLIDIIVIIILLLIAVTMFCEEFENGTINLIKSTKNGKGKTIAAKIIAAILITTLVAALFYGAIAIMSQIVFGFGDVSRPIQSINKFRNCNLLISVQTYLIIYFIIKVSTLILISLIFAIIAMIIKNSTKAYMVIVIFLIINYGLFRFLPALSALSIFKYINIFSFLSPFNIIGEYKNLNFAGYPINFKNVYFSCCYVSIIIAAILNYFIFINTTVRDRGTSKLLNKLTCLKNISNNTSVLFYEFYKTLVSNKLYIVLIIALLIGMKQINGKAAFLSGDERIYKNYISKVSGEITQEKINYIEAEKQKYDNVYTDLSDLDERYNNKEISTKNYQSEKAKLERLEDRASGFYSFYSEYEEITKVMKEENITLQIIDNLTAKTLFDDFNSNSRSGLTIVILMVIMCTLISTYDYENKRISIIKPTLRGRKDIYNKKNIVSLVYSVVIVAVVYIPYYLFVNKAYNINFLKNNIRSLELFINMPFSMPVYIYLIIDILIKIISVYVISQVIMLISNLVKNSVKAMILSSVIIGLPLIAEYFNLKFIRCISFNNIFYMNSTFRYEYGNVINLVYFMVIFILAIVLYKVNYKLYIKRG